MSKKASDISENSRRIARNTGMLYIRMLLMLFIGLFTSRIILGSLGVEDYGIYNAVGGLATVFTFMTGSISTAIVRFLTCEMGRGDDSRLKRVFAASLSVQTVIAVLLVLVIETAGAWLLGGRMKIPEGREGAAFFVMHMSAASLAVNMLAVPYNAVIIARERMGAYGVLSLLEAFLKLSVALCLLKSGSDRLRTYAALMLAVAVTVRFTYSAYCRRHFEESRCRPSWDMQLFREIFSFAGWNFFGTGPYMLNTQGVNIVSNVFFGVTVNAARGVATQVEGIVKQFVSNMLTAFNPQITKSWASGDRDYCFMLAGKASKYAFLIILTVLLPVSLESAYLLRLWFGKVPEYAALFVSLSFCTLLEMVVNPLHTIQLATGRVKRYFLISGGFSYLGLPLVWLAFRLGAPAFSAYPVFFGVYFVVSVLRILIIHSETAFPLGDYLRLLSRLVAVAALSAPLPLALRFSMGEGFARLVLVVLSSGMSIFLSSWLLVLTPGEKAFVTDRLSGLLRRR